MRRLRQLGGAAEKGRQPVRDDVGRDRSEIGAHAALRFETLSEGAFGKAGAELRHDAPGDVDATLRS